MHRDLAQLLFLEGLVGIKIHVSLLLIVSGGKRPNSSLPMCGFRKALFWNTVAPAEETKEMEAFTECL